MSKNQFTGTATQPQRNRNATANYVNLIRTSTVSMLYANKRHLAAKTKVRLLNILQLDLSERAQPPA